MENKLRNVSCIRVLVACMSLLLGIVQLALPAEADTSCVAQVRGVPGNIVHEPHWWEDIGHGVYYQSLDDPRWVGAASITFGDGTTQNVIVRMLRDSTNLYMSVRVTHPQAMTANQNQFLMGFEPSGGGAAVSTVSLASLTPGADMATGSPSFAAVTNSLSGDTLGATTSNPWDQINVWIDQRKPSVPPDTLATAPDSWAVQMRIPLANLTISGSALRMWFEVIAGTPELTGDPQNPLISIATWPRTNAFVTSDTGFVNHYPVPGSWNSFSVASGCTAPSVSLGPLQIGVENNTPQHLIKYAQVPPAASHPINKFFARPTNNSGTDIAANQITATFRIANWGSMADPSDWEAGVNIDDLWAPIQCFANDNAGTTPTTCGTDVGNLGPIPSNNLPADISSEITFNWPLSNAQLLPWVNGTRTVDNCLLVQLSSPIGLVFSNDSIRSNMDFVPASTFKRTAEISIKGLRPIAPDGRDVYIWVETLNMPKVSTKGNQPKTVNTTIATAAGPVDRGPAGQPGIVPRSAVAVGSGEEQVGKPIPIPDANTLQLMASQGRITQAQLDAAVPTYRVHVYHDTGQFMTIAGVRHPLLRMQDAFGVYVSHQGPLYGWQHDLVGEGFTLEKIAKDFYRIKKMPNNSVVRVDTIIKAVEQPPSGKYAVFADFGAAIPSGTFSNVVNTGFSFNGGLEYILNPRLSAEGILGVHHFPGKVAGDVTAVQFGGGVKAFLNPGHPNLVFVRAGAAGYHFSAGTTNAGGYFGAGFLHQFNQHLGVEAVYTFHAVNTPNTTKFSSVQGGVRYAF